jgi:glycerol kinase
MICANLEIMHDEQRLDRLRVCGGLSQIKGLCQRLANLSGLPVERVTASEATARGIAWLAAGRPHDWSHIDLEMFVPANAPGLSQRYALFNDTLQQKL